MGRGKVKRGIIVDVDWTIWNLHDMSIPAAEEIYGFPYREEDMDDWNALRNIYGDDFISIFLRAIDHNNIQKRKMFPEVADTLMLIKNMGFVIHFVTHNYYNPPVYEIHLERWIHHHMPDLDFHCSVIPPEYDKLEFARDLDIYEPWGIIDDKPDTILAAIEQGVPFIASKVWPHNKNIVLDPNQRVMGFENWTNVPKLVRAIVELEKEVA